MINAQNRRMVISNHVQPDPKRVGTVLRKILWICVKSILLSIQCTSQLGQFGPGALAASAVMFGAQANACGK